MLNPDSRFSKLIQTRINYALHEEQAEANSQSSSWYEDEEGNKFWFLYEIANAGLGTYQYPTICEVLGCTPNEDFEIWPDTIWTDFISRLYVPDNYSVLLDYWPDGGCFGFILMRSS